MCFQHQDFCFLPLSMIFPAIAHKFDKFDHRSIKFLDLSRFTKWINIDNVEHEVVTASEDISCHIEVCPFQNEPPAAIICARCYESQMIV